jgi:fibronectin type 3 domain-containing protein
MRIAILGICLLVAACGKVGDPQPPNIRIPEAVKDLNVNQSGYMLVLTWTNPARNIDGSAATNLARVQVRSGTSEPTIVNAGEAGKAQSYSLPVIPGVDAPRRFIVVIETKQGKTSNPSNTASITPVEVPGTVADLRAVVDQRRITLVWSKPVEHPELANAYIVTRTDKPAEPEIVSDSRYEDSQYQQGKTFTYQVTALRRVQDHDVTGTGVQTITVLVEDKTPPATPEGLDIVQSDTSAYLTWDANMETDLAGYHVFRSDRAEGPFKSTALSLITKNVFVDPDYKPGTYYSVSAVDEFGNESPRSAAFRGP